MKRLTKRLLEVLVFSPDTSNEVIAKSLGISEVGVRSRIKRVNRLLGTKSRDAAAMLSLYLGYTQFIQGREFAAGRPVAQVVPAINRKPVSQAKIPAKAKASPPKSLARP